MKEMNWSRVRDILISILSIGVILWAAWSILGRFVDVIVITLLAMVVSFLLTPAVNLFERYGTPRLVSTLLVFVLTLLVLGSIASALAFSLIQQVVSLSTTIQNFFNNLPQLSATTQQYLVHQGIPQTSINQAIGQIQAQATAFVQSTVSTALSIVLIVTGAFINILLVTVLGFYLTLDGKRIRDGIISIIPQGPLPYVLLFEDALNRVVGNYIRGQLTLALIVGILSAFVCLVTGLQNYALIVGALAFLFETIPMVGPGLASIPAILLSLLLPGAFPRTFIVIGCFIIIQVLESNILGPRIVGGAVGLNPVASILALLVGAQLFGPFGALIATPIVAAGWVVVASIYRSLHGETADQMLARRRAPWKMRRPSPPSTWKTRRPSGSKRTEPHRHHGYDADKSFISSIEPSTSHPVQEAPTASKDTQD